MSKFQGFFFYTRHYLKATGVLLLTQLLSSSEQRKMSSISYSNLWPFRIKLFSKLQAFELQLIQVEGFIFIHSYGI